MLQLLQPRQSFRLTALLGASSSLLKRRVPQFALSSGQTFSSAPIGGKYSQTVQLPKTSFDQRANSASKEPFIQKFWEENNIFRTVSDSNPGPEFILHDGPPYANGNLHIGHALNKILKDFINRYQLLKGKKVRFVPGWDTHGLPIEMKVLQDIKSSEKETLTPLSLRQKATDFARKTVEIQKASFKRYGVWADWENPYLTLHPEYEAAQIKVFGEMVARGLIYRGKRPVHWSPSSRTALAEAELEYPDNHVSKSIYCAFNTISLPDHLSLDLSGSSLKIIIWTTTPWTIPANMAVAVGENIEYCIAQHASILNGDKFVVAKDLLGNLAEKLGVDASTVQIHKSILGSHLAGIVYEHPLHDRQCPVVVGGDYINTESGTGLVHTAPGHGQEDFQTGLKYKLAPFSPVDDAGKFTREAGDLFVGKSVLDEGNKAVIEALQNSSQIVLLENYKHKYPYDWRTKKPTIFRITEQWFSNVDAIKTKALEAIKEVDWIPSVGQNRISTMIESRADWCISRQRTWGVPIPAFYFSNGEPLMNSETIDHVAKIFQIHGSDAWWKMETAELLPENFRHLANELQKGTDTMDVWFDSGTSWSGVCEGRANLKFPADVYLEGSDQHRGWFQSSLLTSIAARGIAPYKTVLTHGFVLDEKGFKMSKSLGNVVDPNIVIEGGPNKKSHPAYGADTLRLWISNVDYSGDVCIGDNIIKHYGENYKKIRNTLRFLVANLNDFNPREDSIPFQDLPSIDRFLLSKLHALASDIEQSYEKFQFHKVSNAIIQFCSDDLSSFYFEISKDRLYIPKPTDFRRRSCQTVLNTAMLQLGTLVAPLLPHLAEDLWLSIPYEKASKSIFQNGWVSYRDISFNFSSEELANWNQILRVKDLANKVLEVARQSKVIGASGEASISLFSTDPQLVVLFNGFSVDSRDTDLLKYILVVSQVQIETSLEQLKSKSCHIIEDQSMNLTVGVSKATSPKCERCWFYCESVGSYPEHPTLCTRCFRAIQ